MGTAALAATLAAAGPAGAAPATDAVLAEIQQALDSGDAAHAASLADGALAEGDVSSLQRGRLFLDRGLAKELLGAHQDAMVDFTSALMTNALPPQERAQVLLQRGFLLDSQGKLNDAAGDYGAVIKLAPDAAASALNNRANIYRRQNRPADAKRDYLAALAIANPHPEYPYAGLGQLAEAQGDIEAARGFYAKAAAANPRYGLAAERLAALGGPPAGAIADPDAITLKPPVARSVAPQAKAAPPAETGPADAPIVLRPPPARSAAADDTIHLHMPRKGDPSLRPAMDRSGAEGREVQLGAWRSMEEARQGWEQAVRKAGDALDGLRHVILSVDLPQGHYYRLRATAGPDGARALCVKLSFRGVDCLPMRS